jgi:hypothetical protein
MRIRLTLTIDIDREGKATSKVEGWKVVDLDESLGSAVSQMFGQLVVAKPVVSEAAAGPERPRGGATDLAVARMWADRVGLKRDDLDQGVAKYNVARVIEVMQWMSRQQPRNPAAMFWNVLGKS